MLKKRFNLRNLVTIVACLTVSSMMFSSCNQSAKETKTIPPSVEKYSEQTFRVEELTGRNHVYWTKSGTKYHIDVNCPHLNRRTDDFFEGTVAQSRELKNITELCVVCEQKAINAKVAPNVAAQQVETPITVDHYGYEKRISDGSTFTIILALRTKGEEKDISSFFVSKGIIERGTRDSYNYVSKRDYSTTLEKYQNITILENNTFSSEEGRIPISGKLEKNIIKGTVLYGGKKIPFEAKNSNVERCQSCLGTGSDLTGNLMNSKTCDVCEGYGYKTSR